MLITLIRVLLNKLLQLKLLLNRTKGDYMNKNLNELEGQIEDLELHLSKLSEVDKQLNEYLHNELQIAKFELDALIKKLGI